MTATAAGAEQVSNDPFRLVGTRLDGKYAVESVVAEGGFAVVYRCAHSELQKTVALKVLKIPAHHAQSERGEFFRKFANEARTIARIDHEAIVRVLDFGSSIMPTGDLAPWMALEWLEGQTLEHDLDARAETGIAARTPTECLALLRPVIEAVALAHEEGIAHRDIKPGNLMMVTGRRGDVKMKLLDFGIAKVMTDDDRAPSPGQTSTQPHLQMFSLEHAAPEQLSGTRTGPWTDVHALSLVLTEMLTGEQPYEGDDSVEIFSEALSRRRPTPARWGLDVGPWELVLQRALALRPADRYPDAGSLLKALLAEVPQQAVWREDLSVPPAPSSDRPAPTPAPVHASARPGASARGRAPDARLRPDHRAAPSASASGSRARRPDRRRPRAGASADQPHGLARLGRWPAGHRGHRGRGDRDATTRAVPTADDDASRRPPRSSARARTCARGGTRGRACSRTGGPGRGGPRCASGRSASDGSDGRPRGGRDASARRPDCPSGRTDARPGAPRATGRGVGRTHPHRVISSEGVGDPRLRASVWRSDRDAPMVARPVRAVPLQRPRGC
ncbi:MAG: protein kinase [Deltaproteobacteria bacterium]|nr:protein kinase [Deltaproteobacteria bacterium]